MGSGLSKCYKITFMNDPKISLVICAFNEENYIGNCLQSVLDNSNHFYEIIVVDNSSTDRTKEIVSKFPAVKLVSESQKGLTHARQKGLQIATGEILAYIDADTLMPKGWAASVSKFFMDNSKAVSLSGPCKYHDGSEMSKLFLNFFWWISAPITYFFVGYMLLGSNFAVRKSALEKIDGFDRSISFYGEDTDLARRLSKVGKVVFKMNFFIYASSRRFEGEGIIKASFVYVLNFIWPVIFHKPFTKSYKDVRLNK